MDFLEKNRILYYLKNRERALVDPVLDNFVL